MSEAVLGNKAMGQAETGAEPKLALTGSRQFPML